MPKNLSEPDYIPPGEIDEDGADVAVALQRLRDPDDPVLDWEIAKRDLFGPDVTDCFTTEKPPSGNRA